jgi:hypothetical protein
VLYTQFLFVIFVVICFFLIIVCFLEFSCLKHNLFVLLRMSGACHFLPALIYCPSSVMITKESQGIEKIGGLFCKQSACMLCVLQRVRKIHSAPSLREGGVPYCLMGALICTCGSHALLCVSGGVHR